MKKLSLVLLFCLVFGVISACSSASNQTSSGNQSTDKPSGGNDAATGKKIVIGTALPDFSDKWLSYLQDGMKKYQDTQKDLEVTYVDAQNDANKQLSQVENFISQKVSAIAIVPVDTVSIVDMVDRANKANIPIIVVNRQYDSVDKATAYVGSESLKAGLLETEEVAKLLGGKGNIGIMNGQMGQEAQIKRTEGTKQVVSKNPDMKVVLEGTGSWDRAKGMALMENWLNSGQKINAIVSNNDEMAIGAIMAAEAAGKSKDIVFAGVDATPDALEFVKSGKLQVTVFQNAAGQGQGALETAIKAAKGEKVEKFVYIPYELVTKDNVEEYIKKWK
jgi:inositol transport system substrate-binding protein